MKSDRNVAIISIMRAESRQAEQLVIEFYAASCA